MSNQLDQSDAESLCTDQNEINETTDTAQIVGSSLLPPVPKYLKEIKLISFGNFTCSIEGITELENEQYQQVTKKPLYITAYTRDRDSKSWMTEVIWLDHDNKEHKYAFPQDLFHTNTNAVIKVLAANGLPIIYGKEKSIIRYLTSIQVDNRYITSTTTGWLGEAFVLPNESINQPKGERIIYNSKGGAKVSTPIGTLGSFSEWKNGMKKASSIVKFSVCVSLSASTRFKVGGESGGFHFYDETSKGKTTMLQAAASVWGNSVDSSISGGSNSYIIRWNATTNALEGIAESLNDLPMIIDEIGEGNASEFGAVIYKVLSGKGRLRAISNGDMQEPKAWRGNLISAGELPVSDFIESGGKQLKGGQLVRLVDIDLALLDSLFSNEKEVEAMKTLCSENYGWAGPELIKNLPDLCSGWKSFDHSLIGIASNSIEERVLNRFSWVAYTGVIAVQVGVLPWLESEIIEAVRVAYTAWIRRIQRVSDVDRAINAIKYFILKNKAKFEMPTSKGIALSSRSGWYRNEIYHFLPEEFKAVCKGADSTKVKRQLKKLYLLHINKTKGLNSTINVEGKSVNVVSVKSDIIEDLYTDQDIEQQPMSATSTTPKTACFDVPTPPQPQLESNETTPTQLAPPPLI